MSQNAAIKPFDLFLESVDYSEYQTYEEEEEEGAGTAEPLSTVEPGVVTDINLDTEMNLENPAATPDQTGDAPAAPADGEVAGALTGAIDGVADSEVADALTGALGDAGTAPVAGADLGVGGALKVVILSALEEGDEKSLNGAITEALTQKFTGAEVKEVKLFQLNIQPTSTSATAQEPADGMMMVYEALENADVLLVSTTIHDDKLPYLIYNSLGRIARHYKEQQLHNLVFGSVVTGASNSYRTVRNELIGTFLDLGLVTSAECHLYCATEENADTTTAYEEPTTTLSVTLTALAGATGSLRTKTAPTTQPLDAQATSIKTFDVFDAEGGGVPGEADGAGEQPAEQVAEQPTEVPAEQPAEIPQPETGAETGVEAAPQIAQEEAEEIFQPMHFNDFERSRIPGYRPDIPNFAPVSR